MTTEFKLKKTSDLLPKEKDQICSLFNDVFNKEKSIEKFDRQFLVTALGYSYHGLMVGNGKIVAVYSAIPFKYRYFGKEMLFALAVDTMIAEKYRGNPFNLKKMAGQVYDALLNDGIPFVFGFPNDNIYLVRKRILSWRDIGKLDFYILPVKIGAINNKLGLFNVFSSGYAYLVNMMAKRIEHYRYKNTNYSIEKINDQEFARYRYDDDYKMVKLAGGAYFTYKIEIENKAKVAFLIDVFPLEKRLFETAVKHLYENTKDEAEVIMYVGKLGFWPVNMIKVPRGVSPRLIHMSGKILDPKRVDERVFNIKNWNVNLSNFDVR